MKRKLNKKNMLKFADSLFRTEGGWDYYTELCCGALEKKGMNCALGAMYNYFLNQPMPSESTVAADELGLKLSLLNDIVEEHFVWNLDMLVEINDRTDSYYRRARACRNHIVKKIVPLLRN